MFFPMHTCQESSYTCDTGVSVESEYFIRSEHMRDSRHTHTSHIHSHAKHTPMILWWSCSTCMYKFLYVTYIRIRKKIFRTRELKTLQHIATLCHTLQSSAKLCNALQRSAMHCNALQCTVMHCNALWRSATICNALQRTATHWLFGHQQKANMKWRVCHVVFTSSVTYEKSYHACDTEV